MSKITCLDHTLEEMREVQNTEASCREGERQEEQGIDCKRIATLGSPNTMSHPPATRSSWDSCFFCLSQCKLEKNWLCPTRPFSTICRYHPLTSLHSHGGCRIPRQQDSGDDHRVEHTVRGASLTHQTDRHSRTVVRGIMAEMTETVRKKVTVSGSERFRVFSQNVLAGNPSGP